ncbi:unnamed protein product [Phytomonas sp. Hart1]|nr:unnamed protein product [Phytomonas sp. Hart1]|eukprot:CCW67069.1 unnamed protein product [Phytomonas sp. isolate Hart1]
MLFLCKKSSAYLLCAHGVAILIHMKTVCSFTTASGLVWFVSSLHLPIEGQVAVFSPIFLPQMCDLWLDDMVMGRIQIRVSCNQRVIQYIAMILIIATYVFHPCIILHSQLSFSQKMPFKRVLSTVNTC